MLRKIPYYKLQLLSILLIVGCDNSTEPTDCAGVADIDGNCYETVQIGEQLWMVENLKVTHYNDGSKIPTGYSDEEWSELDTGAYGMYADDSSNADIYGNLYNWFAVDDDGGVCPQGFHVPSDDEYTILTDYLGGTSVAGGKLKEEGYDHWDSPNTLSTNESGFTSLPAGIRGGMFGYGGRMGNLGYFWSSSDSSSTRAWAMALSSNYSTIDWNAYGKGYGFSIRCLKSAP